MHIEWSKIRPLNHSQKEGFEEFVCQLARNERDLKGKSHFLRKGKPDAGVECYWVMIDGDEYAWQAKFFLNSLSDTQWQEVDKSVKTALEKHPRLTQYYIVIPVDRPDARVDGQKSMLQKWNEHVTKWQGWAAAKGMTVNFEYWGQSEMVYRLSYKENEGKHRFWFEVNEFTDDWMNKKLEFAIDALGERYTPKVNFELSIAKAFSGMGRDDAFKKMMYDRLVELFKKFRSTYHVFDLPELNGVADIAEQRLLDFRPYLLGLDLAGTDPIDFPGIDARLREIDQLLEKSTSILYKEQRKKEEVNPTPSHGTRPFSTSLSEVYELKGAVIGFLDFLGSRLIELVNEPFMILTGEAGFGKSHLLADVAERRKRNGQFTLMLLGQHFVTNENPWKQILSSQLLIGGDEYSFLGVLNAKAEASGSRIMIAVDALNEGNGKIFWPDQLKQFIKTVRQYSWLALVVSVRTSYEKLIVDKAIIDENLAIEVVHYGFSEHEMEAADYFFDAYGITKPRIPFLHPEFRSPLFLKLFCDGLKKGGHKEVPPGYEGITAIIDFFLASVNKRLAQLHQYDQNLNLVKAGVAALAGRIATSGEQFIPYENAVYFFNDLKELRILRDKLGFFKSLVFEGVLSKNLYWREDGSHVDGVYFAYERFFDHLVAANLLAQVKNPLFEFSRFGKFSKLFKDEQACYQNEGLLEALSVQIPEKLDYEFFDLVPHIADTRAVSEAFLTSLLWRRKETFGRENEERNIIDRAGGWLKSKIFGLMNLSHRERVFHYLHEIVIKKNKLGGSFLETQVLLCSVPEHIFNVDYLHRRLMSMSMTDRDAFLIPWFNEHYEEGTPIERLIDWSWRDEKRNYLDEESVLLASTMLSWLLISPNRELRDSATKAIICLLQDRAHLLIRLLNKFENVNDPYIYERLFAITYGCAIRAEKKEFLPTLCEYIFTLIFDKELVYPNYLLRDFARGIIEFASKSGLSLSFDVARSKPPYRSEPFPDFPTIDDIDAKYKLKAEDAKHYYYQNEILESMTTEYGRGTARYGDFGRYTFGYALDDWDVNENGLSNYAVELIFQHYDVKKHGRFDANSRSGKSTERIGKKYQWIALFEVLARTSDHYKMYDDSSWGDKKKLMAFEGAWHPNMRDIDVTTVLRATGKTAFDGEIGEESWWAKNKYDNWDTDNAVWLKQADDLPAIEGIIEVQDSTGESWLCLEIFPEWAEPQGIAEDRWSGSHKRLYYQLRGYLISEAKAVEFLKWLTDNPDNDMPESRSRTTLMSREYYWSDAFRFFAKPYYNGQAFHDVHDDKKGTLAGKVHLPVEDYLWEKNNDASTQANISFYKPSALLFDGMQMRQTHAEGVMTGASGEIICLDPSVNEKGPSCLLVRKKPFIEFLKTEKLCLFWTLRGEKQILGNATRSEDEYTSHKIRGQYEMGSKGNLAGEKKSIINTYSGKKKLKKP